MVVWDMTGERYLYCIGIHTAFLTGAGDGSLACKFSSFLVYATVDLCL